MTVLKTVLLSVILVPLALLASAHYAVVDVREHGPDGFRLKMPVPIEAAQLALHFVPDRHLRLHVPEIADYRHLAGVLADELENMEDAELVRVLDGNEKVVVAKVGENLEVHASGDAEEVQVRIPVSTLRALLQSFEGDRFDASRALAALKSTPGGLVHVRDSGTEVRVTW